MINWLEQLIVNRSTFLEPIGVTGKQRADGLWSISYNYIYWPEGWPSYRERLEQGDCVE